MSGVSRVYETAEAAWTCADRLNSRRKNPDYEVYLVRREGENRTLYAVSDQAKLGVMGVAGEAFGLKCRRWSREDADKEKKRMERLIGQVPKDALPAVISYLVRLGREMGINVEPEEKGEL